LAKDKGHQPKRRTRAAGLALLVGATLSGCGWSASPPNRAQALWSSRTPYVGDNSRVVALVRKVAPAPAGTYIIRLETSSRPYRLNIELDRLDKAFAQTDFTEQATLLLGLVANLDEVSITSGRDSRTLTAAAASKALGYEVKDLGRNQHRLMAYVVAQED
jgi:hypothetical protein